MKLKLTELTEKITPLPENLRQKLEGVDLTTAGEYESEISPALAAYLVHCANTLPKLVEALNDCVESLSRLEDKDDAYRVTCLQQAQKALTLAREVEI